MAAVSESPHQPTVTVRRTDGRRDAARVALRLGRRRTGRRLVIGVTAACRVVLLHTCVLRVCDEYTVHGPNLGQQCAHGHQRIVTAVGEHLGQFAVGLVGEERSQHGDVARLAGRLCRVVTTVGATCIIISGTIVQSSIITCRRISVDDSRSVLCLCLSITDTTGRMSSGRARIR